MKYKVQSYFDSVHSYALTPRKKYYLLFPGVQFLKIVFKTLILIFKYRINNNRFYGELQAQASITRSQAIDTC